MIGDLKVWSGTKDVIILKWYERFWRWCWTWRMPSRYVAIAKQIDARQHEPVKCELREHHHE